MSDARRFLYGYDSDLPLEVAFDHRGDRDGMRHVSFLSSGPVRVPALLARASGPPGASGAILVQHGGGESKDDPLIRLLLRRWTGLGFTCLAIDAPGHGERSVSESPVSRRGFFEYLRSRVQNVIDLRRGLDLLTGELGFEESAVGYWGVSMGGSVGVMLLAAEPRLKSACLCLAGARSRRAWPPIDEELADFAATNLDSLALARDIRGAEVLMLNGEDDQVMSRQDAARLFEALPDPKEQRWFRTGHKVTPAMLRAAAEFFGRTLRR